MPCPPICVLPAAASVGTTLAVALELLPQTMKGNRKGRLYQDFVESVKNA